MSMRLQTEMIVDTVTEILSRTVVILIEGS
jgi:hypothetical protein